MTGVAMNEMLERTALLVQLDIYPGLTKAEITDGLTAVSVRLVADAANVACPAGRTAVAGAAIVLAQSGVRLELDVADVAFDEPQPPLREGRFATALRAHLDRLPSAGPPAAPDLVIVFGDAATKPGSGPPVLRLSGDGFACELDFGPGRRWRGTAPFGGLLGACAVGAEAFRLAMRNLGARHRVEPLREHRLTPSAGVRLAVPPVELPLDAAVALDVVSGGAITNGAFFALQRLAGLDVGGRVFDDDVAAPSNLNRYGLLSLDQVGDAKVHALRDLAPAGWRLTPVAGRLNEDTAAGGLGDCVLVGVDDIPARWLAQRRAPGWLCVGATSHFEVVVSEHAPGGPCAGCMHPRDEAGDGPIPTIAFVSMLAGVLQAHRLALHIAGHAPEPPVVAWPMALDVPEGLYTLGQAANPDCPVECVASRRAHSRRAA